MNRGQSADGDVHAESAAYRAAVTKMDRANRRITRVLIIFFALLGAFNIGVDVWAISTISSVRTTQVQNTTRTNCEDKALGAALKDAKLAIEGDHNARDYSVAPKC